MATRFYIVPSAPIAGHGVGATYAAYIMDLSPAPAHTAMRFGLEPVWLLAADVTAGQHTTLAAQSPITVVPANLSSTVGAQLATVTTALDSWNIPSQWVTSGNTYRQLLKGVATMFQFAQRMHGLYGVRPFPAGVTMSTTVGALTQNQRDMLAGVSDSFGWDRSSVTNATTMRQLLRGAAQQWSGPVFIGGETL